MNYAAKNRSGSGGLISMAIVLMVAYLCMKSCQTAAIQNNVLQQSNALANDSNKTLKKQVDSVVQQNRIVSAVAAVVAARNEAQQDAIDSLQHEDVSTMFADSEENRAAEKLSHDISYLRIDVQLLAAQRDSLLALNRSLSKMADSIYQGIIIVAKNDTGKAKPHTPSFDEPYFLGSKVIEPQLPRLQINGNFQLSYNWLLRSPSIGIGTNIYLKHFRIYNGLYYSFGRQQIGATSSGAYDFFNIYSSKK